jgi:pSer/pThr/pTyr-binding forkhead associated (FHA) protein
VIRLVAVIEIEGKAPRALQHESSHRKIIIGRDASADFQIPLSTISRQHARISEADSVYTLEDLGSTHGSILNGRQLGRGDKKVLRDGDVIELTKARITCTIDSEKIVSAEPGEGTQAIAARAVQGILGRLGDAQDEGPFLRVLNGPDEGVRFPFVGTFSEWTLGRSKGCEFILNDPNVSRRHAQVKRDWNGFTVYDLGSKNGVQVNDRTVRKARRLQDQDEITVGPVKLVYVDPNADLMAALEDVPGFEAEEQAEAEELEEDRLAMGVPDEEPEEELPETHLEPEPMEEPDEYADIDPSLLVEEKQGAPIEWILIGVGALVAVLVILVFVLIVG